jgi:hypothetical protein
MGIALGAEHATDHHLRLGETGGLCRHTRRECARTTSGHRCPTRTRNRTSISNGPSFASAVSYEPNTGRLASQTYLLRASHRRIRGQDQAKRRRGLARWLACSQARRNTAGDLVSSGISR